MVAALALLLSGCTAARAPGPEPEPERPVIRVAIYQYQQDNQVIDLLVTAFAAEHPEIIVEKFQLGAAVRDAFTRLESVAQNGTVDLIPLHWGDKAKLRLHLQNLDPLITRDLFDLAPLGPAADGIRHAGAFYDLPYFCTATMLLYNKEMLRQAGVEPPPPEGWTWEQFRAAAARLTTGQGEEKVWGVSTGVMHDLARSWVEEQGGQPIWRADPRVVHEALQFFAALVIQDGSAPREELQDWGSGFWRFANSNLEEFQAGKAAMVVEQRLAPATLRDIPFEWGLATVPTFAGKQPVSVVHPLTMGIGKGSQQTDAAWTFLKFAAGEGGAKALAKAGFQAMYITEAVRQEASPLLQTYSRWALSEGATYTQQDRTHYFYRAVNEVVAGYRTPDEAMVPYQQSMNRR